MTGSLHEKQSHVHTAAGVLYRVLTGFSHPRRRWRPWPPGHDAVDSVPPHDSISLGYTSIFQREKKRFGKIKLLHNKNQPVQISPHRLPVFASMSPAPAPGSGGWYIRRRSIQRRAAPCPPPSVSRAAIDTARNTRSHGRSHRG